MKIEEYAELVALRKEIKDLREQIVDWQVLLTKLHNRVDWLSKDTPPPDVGGL